MGQGDQGSGDQGGIECPSIRLQIDRSGATFGVPPLLDPSTERACEMLIRNRKRFLAIRPRAIPAMATGAQAHGAVTLGTIALGAVAMGALAIGALAIGRLVVGRARIKRLEIDELVVRRIQVTEQLTTPRTSGTES